MFVAALLPLAWLVLRAASLAGPPLGANPVAALTDALGLWALRFLLATLALTPLRWLTGSPRWLYFRRMLGLYAYAYLVLHLAMYVVVDQRLALGVLVEDVLKRPWITLGALGFTLLTPLAVTSTRAAMRRLGRRWTQVHYAIYPAAIAGVWHYYWQVKRDVRSPLAYAFVLALLLGARLVRAYGRRARAREDTARVGARA